MATWLFGVLPGEGVDREAMRKTLHAAARGDGDQTWGTSMVAMCAARLGEPELAVNLLVGDYEAPFENRPEEGSGPDQASASAQLREPRKIGPVPGGFRPSGYAIRRPEQTSMYMPANGGWLAAAAMMAAGWDGSAERAPGFPKGWRVRYEGLEKMP